MYETQKQESHTYNHVRRPFNIRTSSVSPTPLSNSLTNVSKTVVTRRRDGTSFRHKTTNICHRFLTYTVRTVSYNGDGWPRSNQTIEPTTSNLRRFRSQASHFSIYLPPFTFRHVFHNLRSKDNTIDVRKNTK